MKKYISLIIILFTIQCSSFHYQKEEMPQNKSCTGKSLALHFGYSQMAQGNKIDIGIKLPNSDGVEKDLKRIESQLKENCLFKEISLDNPFSDYHLELNYEYKQDIDFIFLLMAGLTSFIIPYYVNEETQVQAILENSKTGEKRASHYKVFQRIWVHPLLLFTTPFFFPTNVKEKALTNMNYKIISDLEKSDFVK